MMLNAFAFLCNQPQELFSPCKTEILHTLSNISFLFKIARVLTHFKKINEFFSIIKYLVGIQISQIAVYLQEMQASSASCLPEVSGLVCSVRDLETVLKVEVCPYAVAWQDFVERRCNF